MDQQRAGAPPTTIFSLWNRAEMGMVLALCLLVLLSYAPALIFSINPLFFNSGLTSATRAGPLRGIPTIDPNAGITTQALGRLSAEYWLHGAVPWWNPYGGVGLPLAAEMQSASLFLPFVLLLHFSSGLLLLKILLQMLAGVATYTFLRQLGCGKFAAFAGGLLFELNGTFAWFQHTSIYPVPFLPVLLLGIERAFAFAGQKRRGGWILIAVAIAYSLYSGFPETAYINGLLALLWAAVRLTGLPGRARLSYAGKVAAGGLSGLLLVAPALLPFFEFLKLSAVAHAGFNGRALPPSGLALLVLPYIYGPVEALSGLHPIQQLIVDWGNIGGYVQTVVLFLAVLALLRGKQGKGLRFGLAIWVAVFTVRVISVSGIAKLASLIPGSDLIALFRVGEPSVEMAGAILAAWALQDWRRGEPPSKTQIAVAFTTTVAIALTAFGFAKPLLDTVTHGNQHNRLYQYWHLGWIAWTALVLLGAATLCAVRYSPGRAALLTALLASDAMLLYMCPVFSGLRRANLDLGPVAFLRQHLGLQRFYAIGRFSPNYAAYFQVASVNYTYLPIVDSWVRYVQSSLDPGIDPVNFLGDFPPPVESREEALCAHLHGFEQTGVKYVMTGAGRNPFTQRITIPHSAAINSPLPMGDGETLSGALSSDLLKNGSVLGLNVTIGTHGKTNGFLEAQLCNQEECVSGKTRLDNAANNLPLAISFSHPLPVAAGESFRYTFTHTGGNLPVTIWTWPTAEARSAVTLSGNRQLPAMPEISLVYSSGTVTPPLVYSDGFADIFELPNPAPYFEADSGLCELSQESRMSLHTSCRDSATLTRRELFYPGWRALVNGNETSLLPSASIFQTIHLPKGESNVVFDYEPTHIRWAYAVASVGLLWVLYAFMSGRRTPRRLQHAATKVQNSLRYPESDSLILRHRH